MKNKRNLIMLCLVIIVVLLITVIFLLTKDNSNTGSDDYESDNKTTETNKKDTKTETTKTDSVKVVKTKPIEYQTYSTNYVSVKIPKGWKVQEDMTSFSQYLFRAYDPNNEDFQIFVNLKTEGFTKSEQAKNYYLASNPNTIQAKLPVLSPQTTEAYFKLYEDISVLVAGMNKGVSYYPSLERFEVIQKLGTSNSGGDILRAKYDGIKGNAEGLFTATIKSITSKLGNVDVGFVMAYNTMFVTAPESEFINYEEILLNCLGSFEYKQAFLDGFYKEQNQNYNQAQSIRNQNKQISEGIMDSWNKRQKSYDIQSQKRSDATLGYERVYDTKTGEVYKAYNGFTDDYKGTRYKAISDSQYSDKVVGYIEK